MITLTGIALNIPHSVVGVITSKSHNLFNRQDRILVTPDGYADSFGYSATITGHTITEPVNRWVVHSVFQVEQLTDGDLVLITPEGRINILYQQGQSDYTVCITNRCNSRCIMCPQPPDNDPPGIADINIKALSLLNKEQVTHIGITGGEPTVALENLCEILKYIKDQYPDVFISLLTNGRKLRDFGVVRQIVSLKNKKLLFCIPLYADNDVQHDRMVGVPGAFQDTVRGIYNLYRLGRKIEIRIVVMRQNFTRLVALAEFMYRNLPFVSHIAFMGMEYTGEAEQHKETLWIDPQEYSQQLYEAVWHLHRRGMNVSIYNIPLCLLKKPLWQFARDSISAWKKGYVEQCADCSVKEQCGGIFKTSVEQSCNISPIKCE